MHTTHLHRPAVSVEPAMSTNAGARRTLRRLELEAYATVVSAFRAQGRLTSEKKTSLELLCKHFGISSERHRAEIRRAVNDELLSSVAYCITGNETDKAWRKEGQKLASTNPRFVSRQITHLPQVLTSAAIAASLRTPSNITAGTADSAPAKKTSASSQLQSALKFIISQNPLASSKLTDVITGKNQSPIKSQTSPVPPTVTTSTEPNTQSSTKNTTSPQKSTQKTSSSPQNVTAAVSQKSVTSPQKVATTPQKVHTSPQRVVVTNTQKTAKTTQTKPVISKIKLQSQVSSKGAATEHHPPAGKEVKTVSKIESLLCDETLSMDTSPLRDQKSAQSNKNTATVQPKDIRNKELMETAQTGSSKGLSAAAEVLTVAKMLSAPLKEDVKPTPVQEKKASMDVATCEEDISKNDKGNKMVSTVEVTVLPVQATGAAENEKTALLPTEKKSLAENKATSNQVDETTDQKSTAVSRLVAAQPSSVTPSSSSVSRPVTAVPLSVTPSSSSVSQPVTAVPLSVTPSSSSVSQPVTAVPLSVTPSSSSVSQPVTAVPLSVTPSSSSVSQPVTALPLSVTPSSSSVSQPVTAVPSSVTPSSSSVSQPVTAVPLSVSTLANLSSGITTATVTKTSLSEMLSSSDKETRKRSAPFSEDVPPPKKQNIAPTTLSLSQPKPDQIIPKAVRISPLITPLSVATSSAVSAMPPLSIAVPTTPLTPLSVPTTPLPVEVPSTPLTPASIQEFSELDPTAENLIDALCSDSSSVDDSTLASQLGLDSVDTSVMNLSQFLNIIQPENVLSTSLAADSSELGSSASKSETITKTSTIVATKQAPSFLPCVSTSVQETTTVATRAETMPTHVSSVHTFKPSLARSVTIQPLTSTMVGLVPSQSLVSMTTSVHPPHVSKDQMTSTTTSVDVMMSIDKPVPSITTTTAKKMDSLPTKQGDQPSASLLDFTDIGSLLGSEDKLLEDIPEELAESIHALAMLDEKSTRVTWKQ